MSKEILKFQDEETIIGNLKKVNKVLIEKKVGFDIDGFEVDSTAEFLKVVKERIGLTIKKEQCLHAWAAAEIIEASGLVEDARAFCMDHWNSDRVLGSSKCESGAFMLSRFVHSDGVRPHRITARPSITERVTRDWYKSNMPWVGKELIHVQEDGNEVRPFFKVDKINEYNISYYFEDQFENVDVIIENTDATVILVPQWWNSTYKPPNYNGRLLVVKDYLDYPIAMRAYLTLADKIIEETL